MAKLLLVLILSIAFGITHANASHEATVLTHQEWVTGVDTLHYNLSTAKHPRAHTMTPLSQGEKEDILLWPSIDHVETHYDNPQYIHTQITGTFHMQVRGFYEDNEPQIFQIVRRVCVIPSNDTPVDSFNCFHSKELISITRDMNNAVDVNIDIFNLPPGEYVTDTSMSVEQIQPSCRMAMSYSSIGNGLKFIIHAKT